MIWMGQCSWPVCQNMEAAYPRPQRAALTQCPHTNTLSPPSDLPLIPVWPWPLLLCTWQKDRGRGQQITRETNLFIGWCLCFQTGVNLRAGRVFVFACGRVKSMNFCFLLGCPCQYLFCLCFCILASFCINTSGCVFGCSHWYMFFDVCVWASVGAWVCVCVRFLWGCKSPDWHVGSVGKQQVWDTLMAFTDGFRALPAGGLLFHLLIYSFSTAQ